MKKTVTYFTLFYTIFCSTIFLVSTFVYQTAVKEEIAKVSVHQETVLAGKIDLLKTIFNEIHSDLYFLTDDYQLKSFLSSETAEDKRRLQKAYSSFAYRKKRYDQIRLLNLTGDEIIRITYRNGNVSIKPEELLQNKAKRYYFEDVKNSDSIYISPMDLNVEHRVVEKPFRPMIRFGVTVNNLEGQRKGILLLNYLGQHVFDVAMPGAYNDGEYLIIINTEGYFLYGVNQDELWGFMFKDRSKDTFQNKYPDVWANINDTLEGQIQGISNLFTWQTFIQGNQKEWYWKIISRVPLDAIQISIKNHKRNLIVTSCLFMIFMIIPTTLLAREVYRRKLIKKKLIRSANYDYLTGLGNRTLFYTVLGHMVADADRYNEKFALLFIDIDGFKEVNDSLGHDMGDKTLISIAKKIKDSVRDSDFIARLGGDEFVVLIKKISSPNDAEKVANKIIFSISNKFDISLHTINVGASIGISIYPDSSKLPDELVRKADNEMYRCKEKGKNNYSLCPPEKTN